LSAIEYRPITCQHAVNRVVGMPFRWSLNPYRGCTHACQYCYARVTHQYLDLGAGRDFERVIFVKTNVAEALRQDLTSRAWRHESITIGTATDPYQPAEGRFQLTRRCLEVMLAAANPCSITTKGTLIVRDLDVLAELSSVTNISVHVSLITLSRDLWRRVEPGTPPPRSRLRAIERLSAAGIPTSVFLMPILPGLTDQPANLADVIRAAADHGASRVSAGALRLAPGVKELFLDFLRDDHPRLVASYARGYGRASETPARYRQELQERVARASDGVAFGQLAARQVAERVGQQYVMSLSEAAS
jgi:DNA repair photolyase